MKVNRMNGLGTTLALGLLVASGASATAISGNVSINGTASVSGSYIDFFTGLPACATGPNLGTPGCFTVGGVPDGDFTGLSGTPGTIKDLTGSPTGPQNVPQFMSFINNIFFDLTSIPAAGTPGCSTIADPSAGGVSCVPSAAGPSGFRLTNGPGTGPSGTGPANTVGVQFTVNANGYLGSKDSGYTSYIGIFTTQIAGKNAQDILTALAANGGTGSFTSSYSGSFAALQAFPSAAVPEPGTTLLMGAGLIGLAFASRRFVRQ